MDVINNTSNKKSLDGMIMKYQSQLNEIKKSRQSLYKNLLSSSSKESINSINSNNESQHSKLNSVFTNSDKLLQNLNKLNKNRIHNTNSHNNKRLVFQGNSNYMNIAETDDLPTKIDESSDYEDLQKQYLTLNIDQPSLSTELTN